MLTRNNLYKAQGVSLTELMIGSLIGLLVVAGAMQLYLTSLRGTADNLRLSRLNQELRGTLDLLRNDLRRAGYWAIEPGGDRPAENPFHAAGVDLHIGEAPGEPVNSCVLYSYDANGDRLVGVGPSGTAGPSASTANLEQFGFRLRGGQVQMRNGGSPFSCTGGSWQAVTDPDTEITRLRFDVAEECINLTDSAQDCAADSPALVRRSVHIVVSGRSRSDNRVTQQLDSTVVIANDKLLALFAP